MPTTRHARELHGYWTEFSLAAQLEARYRKLMTAALRKSGLGVSVREWQALAYIATARTEERSVLGRWVPTRSGVMRALDIDKAAASRLVSTLVHKGHLAELLRKKADQRMKVLTLGMTGRRILSTVLTLEEDVMSKLWAGMGAHAAKDAQSALAKLRRAFDRTHALSWHKISDADE